MAPAQIKKVESENERVKKSGREMERGIKSSVGHDKGDQEEKDQILLEGWKLTMI